MRFIESICNYFEQKTQALFGDRTWPDAAFIIEKGAEKDDNGKTLQKYRHLVHHSKSAKDPNENSSVDIPHLRNALARVNQVKPISENKSAFIKRATSHLQKHARALLKTYKNDKTKAQELLDICEEFNINIEKEKE